jgi:hypothetical protein
MLCKTCLAVKGYKPHSVLQSRSSTLQIANCKQSLLICKILTGVTKRDLYNALYLLDNITQKYIGT